MDYKEFKDQYNMFNDWNERFRDSIESTFKEDRVNHPSHYTRGRLEAIDVIEDAIIDAPTPAQGMLQAQALKYLLRIWNKDNPAEDAKKARWYLDRLITKFSEFE
jgi:hypothetical protein